ncbi:MAG: substrate-binding domain-containing protein [Actinomycetota bacterium]|nr:substrate-binding domain-containing protein [Actinomycetota bacterium]
MRANISEVLQGRATAQPETTGSSTRQSAADGVSRTGRRRPVTPKLAVTFASAVALASVAACGSSSPPAGSSTASSGSSGGGSGTSANVAAAQAAINAFTGHPSAFPVSTPLSKPLPKGTKFVFMQCSTPVCGQVAKSFAGAVKAIGGELSVVNAGATAQSAQAAAATALAMKPKVVLLSGTDPTLYGSGLKALSDAGTKVVSIQVNKDVKPFGISFNYLGTDLSAQNGKLLADWVFAKKGAKANAVFYSLPALDLSSHVQEAFQTELKKVCPTCKSRVVPIDVATAGTTSAQTVVTDLQSHPDANVAVFVSFQVATGLPAALKAAGKTMTTVGFGPTTSNLQDIKDGGLTAGLAIDFPVSIWTAVDTAARLVLGDQPSKGAQSGQVPEQFLSQKDITFDPSKGWTGYPDFVQRFLKLWHPAS